MKNIIQFLKTLPGAPRVIRECLALNDVREIPGRNHSSIIMGWIKELGRNFAWIKNDEIAWCSTFAAIVYKRADKDVSMITAAAASWVNFGTPIGKNDAVIGDALVFKRPGGNHIGVYCAENKDSFYIFGGNQSNKTGITRMAKSRLLAVRRPVYKVAMPEGCIKNYMDLGGAFSENEQ
jgi:uncharacterized protein (TIGR02594 family)